MLMMMMCVFVGCFYEIWFHYVTQAGLELLLQPCVLQELNLGDGRFCMFGF